MSGLTFKNIHKRYGDNPYTIRDVNIDIKDGEFCVFVGPSGCGKSTLLRMVGWRASPRAICLLVASALMICRRRSAATPWCSKVTPCTHT